MATEQGMRIAEEQAGLRRVATLVAAGAPPEDVLSLVTAEVGRLLDVGRVNLVRYDSDDAATTVGAWAGPGHSAPFAVGAALRLGGNNVTTHVFRTGRPARIDDYSAASGMIGEAVWGEQGVRSAVGVPISVEGRLWGCIVTSSAGTTPLPANTEERLVGFTELVATALANAQARTDLRAFADEQAALRNVATLVAGAAQPEEMFAAVAAEIGGLLPADMTTVARYEPDDVVTVLGAWSSGGTALPVPVGTRAPLGGHNVATLVFQGCRSARLDDYGDATGAASELGRALGIRAAVGAPITVEGRLWGLITVVSLGGDPLPRGTETRLAGFAELVATAIANAQARSELRAFAEEQAALQRVATLVARGAAPEDVFAAVTDEAGRLLRADGTDLGRYDGDGVVYVGVAGDALTTMPVGTRAPLGGRNVSTLVFETGRPARIDDYTEASGAVADLGRGWGTRAAVGVPVHVEGRVWGVVVATARTAPFPPGTEDRLAGFTELVATAIANAQARVEVRVFAAEQAALRRVATLVARGVAAEEVFSAVTAEVGRLLRCDDTVMSRYDTEAAATVVGAWSATGVTMPVPVGHSLPLGERNVHTLVARTHQPVRLDSYGPDAGAAAAAALAVGMHSAVGVPIAVDGRPWGVMIAASRGAPLPPDTEARLAGFTELVATAVANAEAQAQLTASRARIVATADATRRRIERDLHDIVQQHLVSLALELRVARAGLPPDAGETAGRLARVTEGLGGVLDELREVIRGIHPAALAQGGLRPALKALARRSPVPVRLDVSLDGRLPSLVELAAYYTVAEALTNTAKHASATVVDVKVARGEAMLSLDVRDDGRGGATLGSGSGLVGLTDRAEALGGHLTLHSPPGAGTSLQVLLPLAVPDQPAWATASAGR